VARQNSSTVFFLATVGSQGNSHLTYTDLAIVAEKINKSTKAEDISDVLDISSEVSNITFKDSP